MKGEQGKPEIKANSRNPKNISSENERKNNTHESNNVTEEDNKNNALNVDAVSTDDVEPKKKKTRQRQPKTCNIQVDREQKCYLDKSTLPADATSKGFSPIIIQDIKIVTDNVRYLRESYYSPSLNKTFTAPLPDGIEGQGEFGIGVRSLIPLFKTDCRLPERGIRTFFDNFNIQLSLSYISQQWTKGYQIFHQEKNDIIHAGLTSCSYQQIDDTGARVMGENQYTHVLCNPYFAAFFTTLRKDRLTVLDVFRNFAPREFIYNDYAIDLIDNFNLSNKFKKRVHAQFEKYKVIDEQAIDHLLDLLKAGPQQSSRVKEACAIAQYREQTAIPVIGKLMSDDAPQFKLLTQTLALCWVHDGRHYKKPDPIIDLHKLELERFVTKYWQLYHKLNAYKASPNPIDKAALYTEFDLLFSTCTAYDQLNARIAKTLAKRTELLVALEHPEMPLHNNGSESGARAQARYRDISLHTMSLEGTEMKDSSLTLCETAKKLGVRLYDYIKDRVSGEYKLPSLASLIIKKSEVDKAIDHCPT